MLATFTVWFFLTAATWSRIHGGTSELMLLILTTLVTPSPPLSGFLAGRAIDGEWRRREPIPGTDPIHFELPTLRCWMSAAEEHGPFHYSHDRL